MTQLVNLPPLLAEIQQVVRFKVSPELLDKHGTWIHYSKLHVIRATAKADRRQSRSLEDGTLRRAQYFLAPLAEHKGCRSVGRGNRWANPCYSPPTPFGEYWWVFTVEMVQEILWGFPEFVEGYEHAITAIKVNRDDNPYKAELSRSTSWDVGYILGLAERHSPAKIRTWLKSHQEDLVASDA